jgi:hypothetical protein
LLLKRGTRAPLEEVHDDVDRDRWQGFRAMDAALKERVEHGRLLPR